MKVLLLNPRFPETFWSLTGTVGFKSAKSAFPSLGLLTVGAMLPREWSLRYLDLNVEDLSDKAIAWADLVFIGAMAVQSGSALECIGRCQEQGKTVVAGGPYFSILDRDVEGVDHLFIGEVEETLPVFLADLAQGRARPVYRTETFPGLDKTPIPRWDLVDFSDFLSMPLQMGRGCPNDCDFCHVVILNGRQTRLKPVERIIAELEALYQAGWRHDEVMLVDDNFIGRKRSIKEVLKAVAAWQEAHGYPYFFSSQASVDLADDQELLSLAARAGVQYVFLGIESPAAASLEECHKVRNQNRDLKAAVRAIQGQGINVVAGFILGFDADTEGSFGEMADFIEGCPIPHPMIGLLNIPPGTRLWTRMEEQGRILGLPSGDNVGDPAGVNYVPKMGLETLIRGYIGILQRIYGARGYYARLSAFMRRAVGQPFLPARLRGQEVRSFFKLLWRMGLRDPDRLLFWKYFFSVLAHNPREFPLAMTLAAIGRHYRFFHERAIKKLEKHLSRISGE